MARGKQTTADQAPVEALWDLPDGWRWERLGDCGRWASGGTPSAKNTDFYGGAIPWLTSGELNDGIVSSAEKTISQQGFDNSSVKWVQPGTLLIAMYGATIGKTAITGLNCTTNQAIAACHPYDGYNVRFLFYYALSQRDNLRKMGQGGAQPNISQALLKDYPCPICPPEVQSQIVARIDALFAEIAAGEAELVAARAGVETYRKALLKAAVTGELTADWRREQAASGQPQKSGQALLARILTGRRTRWHADPKNAKKKYAEPAGPDTDGLPELPEGWAWASPIQILNWSSGKFLPDKSMIDGPVPVYGGNGINGRHNIANVEIPTLVIGRVGYYCGNAFATDGPAWITDNAIHASNLADDLLIDFLRLAFTSANLGAASQGGAQPFVSQTMLNEVSIPLPSVCEQKEIVRQFNLAIAALDDFGSTVSGKAATTLRQSILAAAFRGDLIP